MKACASFVSIFAFVFVVRDAPAAKLSRLDWLASWKNAEGKLSNSRRSFSGGNYGDSAGGGGIGTWAVTSDQGSAGARHAISGQSFCSTASSGAYSGDTPGFAASPDNKNCWCRMTSPDIGGSWVFLGTSLTSALCADDCAYHCAYCVQSGAYYSCSRSVVLALP